MNDDVNDLFSEENIPESNWFKFEKVGDRVFGELIEVYDAPAKDEEFGPQRVYVLKQGDGTATKVGVRWDSVLREGKEYVVTRADRAALGDTLGFEFKKLVPARKKGKQDAKSIEVYVKKRPMTPDEDFNSVGK